MPYRRLPLALLIPLGLAMLACQGQPVPLSAQVGSTMVIPLVSVGHNKIGYGGTEYTDAQRGGYVFALGDLAENGGTELTTRFTIPVTSEQRTELDTPQLIAVVDIVNPYSETITPGTQTLHLSYREPDGTLTTLNPPRTWTVAILPALVDTGTEWVTGQSTPLETFDFLGDPPDWEPLALVSTSETDGLDDLIPRPAIAIGAQTDQWATSPRNLSSLIAEVSFPDDLIQIVGTANSKGRATWYEDLGVDGGGIRTIRVSGASVGLPLKFVDLVFELKGSTPLAPGDIVATVSKATDFDMTPVASPLAFVQIH